MSASLPKKLSPSIVRSQELIASTHATVQRNFSTNSHSQDLISSTRALVQKTTLDAAQIDLRKRDAPTALERSSKYRRRPTPQPSTPADVSFSSSTPTTMEAPLQLLMHDIRNPINNINSLAQLLKASHDLPQPLQHLVELMIEQSKKVHELTQFHVFYQQLESGNYQPQRSRFNLLTLLLKVLRQIQSVHCTNMIELRVDGQVADITEAYMFFADLQATELMLHNLIQNAVEASPPHAPVRVDISTTVQVREETRQNPCISIHNQGMIPASIQSRFFDKFVTSGKSKGTGLGTYIASRVAKSHGGAITFTTSHERGTTLCVELPDTSGCLP